jgi:hypothetical protein
MLGNTWKEITLTESQGLWAVLYQDQPFGLRTQQIDMVRDSGRKYPKTVFPNPGHAKNLACKLNHWFDSEQFSVRKIL